jgi:hypothetical protein
MVFDPEEGKTSRLLRARRSGIRTDGKELRESEKIELYRGGGQTIEPA